MGRGDFSRPLDKDNMAQPPHFEIDGVIYFITTRIEHEGFFLTEHEAEIIVNTILDSSTRKEMTLYAYVIMPNHMHILIKPIICGVSKAMQFIKGRSSRQINEGNFWQKGFLILESSLKKNSEKNSITFISIQ